MICNKCKKKEAEFDSPDDLCQDCWVDWWVDGLEPRSEEEREQLRKETMANVTRTLDEPV